MKQHFAIVSIDEGIQIDRRELHDANADRPRTEIFEPDANVTFASRLHRTKPPSEISSIDAGKAIA
jgi:hypothetical protein